MLFPPLTIEEKRALKRSGPLDDAIMGLVEHIVAMDDGYTKLANMSLDNFSPSISMKRNFQEVILQELNYALCDRDAEIIVKQFTQHNTFNAKAFLNAFEAYYDYDFKSYKLPKLAASQSMSYSPCSSARTDTSFSSMDSTSSSASSAKSSSTKNFWKLAKNKSQLFSATQLNLVTSIEDRTLSRAVAALEESLRHHILNDMPESKLLLGNIKLWEFKE